jgi:hypothetical protein
VLGGQQRPQRLRQASPPARRGEEAAGSRTRCSTGKSAIEFRDGAEHLADEARRRGVVDEALRAVEAKSVEEVSLYDISGSAALSMEPFGSSVSPAN